MQKYQELEAKIAELQKEVERLKKVEEENQLPDKFNRDQAIKFLINFDYVYLNNSFIWESTPQGSDYWVNVYNLVSDGNAPPQDAVIAIQRWIILSYRKEYGD